MPSHGKDVASRSCLLFEVLAPQAAEAIFAGGHGPQGFNMVACRQAGRIILWDEGPAKGTKLVPVRVNTKD